MKKSIFKRWWFWLIVVIVVFAVIGSMGGGGNNTATTPGGTTTTPGGTQPTPNTTQPAPAAQTDIWDKAGMYKVGTDIPEGEYLLVADSFVPAYFQVTKDSSGSLESIISNDNFEGSRYVTVLAGQYFEVKNAKFTPADKAPVQEAKNGVYEPGMYKVGRDIQAGEYKLKAEAGTMAYFEVSKDSTNSLNSIVANDNFEGEKYVTIAAGQYIKINGCQLSK